MQLFQSLSEGQKNSVDIKVIMNLIGRRFIKLIPYIASSKEIDQHINFFEFLYKIDPVSYYFFGNEIKLLIHRAKEISEQ